MKNNNLLLFSLWKSLCVLQRDQLLTHLFGLMPTDSAFIDIANVITIFFAYILLLWNVYELTLFNNRSCRFERFVRLRKKLSSSGNEPQFFRQRTPVLPVTNHSSFSNELQSVRRRTVRIEERMVKRLFNKTSLFALRSGKTATVERHPLCELPVAQALVHWAIAVCLLGGDHRKPCVHNDHAV